jgi:hypothetical protein
MQQAPSTAATYPAHAQVCKPATAHMLLMMQLSLPAMPTICQYMILQGRTIQQLLSYAAQGMLIAVPRENALSMPHTRVLRAALCPARHAIRLNFRLGHVQHLTFTSTPPTASTTTVRHRLMCVRRGTRRIHLRMTVTKRIRQLVSAMRCSPSANYVVVSQHPCACDIRSVHTYRSLIYVHDATLMYCSPNL